MSVIGPFETELNTYNSGVVAGLVVGAFGELSPALHDLAYLIASEICADYRQFYYVSPNDGRALFLQQVRRSWGSQLTARGPSSSSTAAATWLKPGTPSIPAAQRKTGPMRMTPKRTQTFITTTPREDGGG